MSPIYRKCYITFHLQHFLCHTHHPHPLRKSLSAAWLHGLISLRSLYPLYNYFFKFPPSNPSLLSKFKKNSTLKYFNSLQLHIKYEGTAESFWNTLKEANNQTALETLEHKYFNSLKLHRKYFESSFSPHFGLKMVFLV